MRFGILTGKSHHWRSASILLCVAAAAGSVAQGGDASPKTQWHWKVPDTVPGARYEATVPDTLDLADRAELSLNVLTGALDPEQNYEVYFLVNFYSNPPCMHHERTGLPTNNPKFAESLPMMRVMCGSNVNREIETRMMEYMVTCIGDDGLYYAIRKGRPWHGADEDFANLYGNVRFLLAMKAWYYFSGDDAWKARIEKLTDALGKIALLKDDYAYYPTSTIGEWHSFGRNSGWLTSDEPAGHPSILYVGPVLRGIAQAEAVTGKSEGRGLGEKLCRFLRLPKYWQREAGPQLVDGPSRAQWKYHFHETAVVLRGLLDFAILTNDSDLLEFVRDGYEYSRQFGIARVGYFPERSTEAISCETCCIADMVALAIRLSEAGIGDYWDDVDRYVRNQLVEQQFTSTELIRNSFANGSEVQVSEPESTADRVIERNVGAFAGWAALTHVPAGSHQIMHCCTGNGTQALYYAWESIIRESNGVVQINLLLNRAAPSLDIDSYLPYEGKVVLRNKTAKTVSVRMPRWVDRKSVSVWKGGKPETITWAGSNVVVTDLMPNQVVTITFPVDEREEKAVLYGKPYTFTFRGNTVVDVEPKDRPAGCYPLYVRDHLKADKAPMKTKERFVSAVMIPW